MGHVQGLTHATRLVGPVLMSVQRSTLHRVQHIRLGGGSQRLVHLLHLLRLMLCKWHGANCGGHAGWAHRQ
eukprot:scaffold44468_cov19-Tisochrysis_lutea.AAC.3